VIVVIIGGAGILLCVIIAMSDRLWWTNHPAAQLHRMWRKGWDDSQKLPDDDPPTI
jgi:hypothetical protein